MIRSTHRGSASCNLSSIRCDKLRWSPCAHSPSGRFTRIITGRSLSRSTRRPGCGCGWGWWGWWGGEPGNCRTICNEPPPSWTRVLDCSPWRRPTDPAHVSSGQRRNALALFLASYFPTRLLKAQDDAANNLTVAFKAPSRSFRPAHYCTERLHTSGMESCTTTDSSMALLHASQASKEGPLSKEH